MPRPKSFLCKMEVDTAKRTHYCQHNKKHSIICGQKRLKVHFNRTYEHYCTECAKKFLNQDILELHSLISQLNSE